MIDKYINKKELINHKNSLIVSKEFKQDKHCENIFKELSVNDINTLNELKRNKCSIPNYEKRHYSHTANFKSLSNNNILLDNTKNYKQEILYNIINLSEEKNFLEKKLIQAKKKLNNFKKQDAIKKLNDLKLEKINIKKQVDNLVNKCSYLAQKVIATRNKTDNTIK